VPLALATDDQGVSRSDMTHEYLRAVEDQHLTYADLKRMARASLEHSFIAGQSLLDDGPVEGYAPPCRLPLQGSGMPDATCQTRLDHSERARLQWQLEKAFVEFEKKF
jgi:adenosine deaminase